MEVASRDTRKCALLGGFSWSLDQVGLEDRAGGGVAARAVRQREELMDADSSGR